MPNQEIYTMLFEYIKDDNNFKRELLNRVGAIETQTKITNGKVINNTARIIGLEEVLGKVKGDVIIIQQKESTGVVVKEINWKWIAALGSIAFFLVNLTITFIVKFLDRIIK